MSERRSRDALQRAVKELERKVADLEERERVWSRNRRYYERSHAEFMSLLENADDYILISDENGVPQRFNDAYARIMREVLDLKMAPGIQPHKLLDDPQAVAYWDGLHRRVLAGESFRAEFSVPPTRSEGMRHFEFSFCPIRNGDAVEGFTEIAREITERKHLESELRRAKAELEAKVQARTEALSRTEAHLRSLMENATGFVVYRLEGEGSDPGRLRVVFVSPSAGELMGVRDPMDFDSWFASLHPEDAPRVAEANRRALESGRFEEQFRFFNRRRGGWRWLHAISSGGVEGPGDRFYVNGIMIDITEKKETELELQRRELELDRKATALEEVNTALKVVIDKKAEDREHFEKKLVAQARMLIRPYIDKLRDTELSERQASLLSILESNLEEMTSGLSKRIASAFVGLTRQEMQIASLIRQGKTSRQIAGMLDLSPRTIDAHRANLRRKLGLRGKKANLRSYLLSLRE